MDKEGIAYPDESLPGSRKLCQVCKKDKTKNGVVFMGRKHEELTPRSAGVTIKFCPFINDPNLYDNYVAEQKEKRETEIRKGQCQHGKEKEDRKLNYCTTVNLLYYIISIYCFGSVLY